MSGTPYTPAQLGVRPAPALVQSMLIGAFGWMFAGLLLSAGVSYLVDSSPDLLKAVLQWWLPLIIVQLVLGIGIQVAINKVAPTVSLLLFFVYAASMGLTIGVIVWSVMQEAGGTQAVASAFFSTAGMFGAASLFGAVTKRDLSKVGSIAVMALFGIIIASLVNLFLKSDVIYWVVSYAGVALFTVLTAWDVQRISNGTYAAMTRSPERAAVLAALHLYLNFINMFLFLLRIFGGRN